MEIQHTSDGFSVCGALDYANAPHLLAQGRAVLEEYKNKHCVINLAALKEKNTVILAVLVAWKRFAHEHHIQLRFMNMSDSVARMVKCFGLSELMLNG
jgi:ABC-type transporter Mla MlaB component